MGEWFGRYAAAQRRRPSCTFVLFLLLVGAGCHNRRTLKRSVIEANLIFQGTVRRIGASTMPDIVAPASNTYIVEISKSLTPSADEFTGQSVTFRLNPGSGRKPDALRAGDSFVFLVRPLVYADSLAVAGDVAGSTIQVFTSVQNRADLILQERLRMSDLVVSGSVTNVERYALVDESEHKPDWQQARIAVTTTEKGRSPRTLEVVFPASKSFIWTRSPKFAVGQQGIWLLQHTRDLVKGQAPYTALHPLDFQSSEQLGRIRRLLGIKNPPGGYQNGTPASPGKAGKEAEAIK